MATIHVVVGLLSFSIHLWWENLSWVILVNPKRNCIGQEVREDVVWSPHARRSLVLNGESLERDRGYVLDLGQKSSNDKAPSLVIANGLVPWRRHVKGSLKECKGNGYYDLY